MYLIKQVIEKRVFEELDKIVLYNNKNLVDVLPIEERSLLCSHIMGVLPSTIPDLRKKFHKAINANEILNKEDTFYHLIEEVIELGLELGIKIEDIYSNFTKKISKISKEFPNEYVPTKEGLVQELSDVTLLTASIAEFTNVSDILYDAILEVDKSLYTKICQSIEEVKETVKICKEIGIEIETKDLGNNKFVILKKDSNKLIKPVGYKKPTFNHLIKK